MIFFFPPTIKSVFYYYISLPWVIEAQKGKTDYRISITIVISLFRKMVKNYVSIQKTDISFNFTISVRKMPKWKALNSDSFHSFWWKKFTSPHQSVVDHLDECIKTWNRLDWKAENCRKSLVITNFLLKPSLETAGLYNS